MQNPRKIKIYKLELDVVNMTKEVTLYKIKIYKTLIQLYPHVSLSPIFKKTLKEVNKVYLLRVIP